MNSYMYVGIDMPGTGARIKALRQKNHFTVEALCEILCVSPQAIYKWQNGESLPTLDNIMVLSDIFKVKVEDIVAREGAMSSFIF